MSGSGYKIMELHRRAVTSTAIFAVIVIFFAPLAFVSCSGGKDVGKGEGYKTEPGGISVSGGEEGKPHSTGPGTYKVLDLEFTAKTALTYLVDGEVEEVEEGFVAISGEKTRYEAPAGRGFPYTLVTIDRGDLDLAYVLVPERKRYFEFEREAEEVEGSGAPGGDSSAEKRSPGQSPLFGGPFGSYFGSENEVSRELIGTEEVSGLSCEKYRVKEEFLDGTHTRYTEWLAVDLNRLPVKTEYRLKAGARLYITRWELTEIKRGPPPPDLFTVPEGYVRVKDITEALKGDAP